MNRPERVFAAIALVAGLALAIAMPPGAAPDETRHLSRVYVMSEGFFGVPGTAPPRITIPKSIPELYRSVNGDAWPKPPPRRTIGEMRAFLEQPLDPERRIGIANAGTYTPIVYLPHLLGVAPGRWLELSPAALVYLGRVASLLVWIALTALAIQLAPARKWTLALLSLTPMSIASAASISGDPMTNAAALLFTVLLLRAIAADRPLAARDLLPLLGASLFLGVAKPGYWPLALAAFAIPTQRFEQTEPTSAMNSSTMNLSEPPEAETPVSRRSTMNRSEPLEAKTPVSRVASQRRAASSIRLAFAAAIGLAVLAPSLAWIAFAQQSAPAPPIAGSDPVAQLGFVLGHPFGFVAILLRTIAQALPSYWTTFVGELGPLLVKLPVVLYVAWLPALVAAIVADGPPLPLARGARNWLALAFAASIVTMFTMAYLGWNPVGEPVIRGVQGRYWAPAVPMLVFALPSREGALPETLRLTLLGVAATSLVAVIGAVFGVYYRG